MSSISIRHLGKDAPAVGKQPAARILGDVSLEIRDGELLVLVGPSGCGKTTLLRCIAGLETPTRGDLFLDGDRMIDRSPAERDIAMVFQSYALYPHLTVRENLAFGLKMRRTPAAETEARVAEAASMLGLSDLLDRLPQQLSGGQRQRVAMGRAVVRRPRAFLFDEPLSNLDAALRGQMRVEIKRLHARLGATMVYVTHDQVEAMTLADRIVVLRAGVIEQVGTPDELYRAPQNLFVARFLGTPEMNTLPGRIEHGRFRFDQFSVDTDGDEGPATLGIRPEDIRLAGEPGGEDDLAGVVDVIENLGGESLVHVRVGALLLCARVPSPQAPAPSAKMTLQLPRAHLHLFDGAGQRIAARAPKKLALER